MTRSRGRLHLSPLLLRCCNSFAVELRTEIVMEEDAHATERARSLATLLGIPLIEDDVVTVGQILRTHERERDTLRRSVALVEEPSLVFSPTVRRPKERET